MYVILGNSVFDLTYPISSIIALFVESSFISLSVYIADFIIAHGIEAARIRIMSIVANVLVPVVFSLLLEMFPILLFQRDYSSIIGYVLPVIVWIVLGELFLRDLDFKKKAMIAVLGYGLFLFFNAIHLQAIIHSVIHL